MCRQVVIPALLLLLSVDIDSAEGGSDAGREKPGLSVLAGTAREKDPLSDPSQGKQKRITNYWDFVKVTYFASPSELRQRLPPSTPRFGMHVGLGHKSSVSDLEFSPDGRLLASASEDGTARLWDMTTGCELKSFLHDGPVKSVTFNPDGSRIMTGTDSIIEMWHIRSGSSLKRETVNVMNGQNLGGLRALAINQEGSRIAFSLLDGIKLRDLTVPGYVLFRRRGEKDISGSISSDGRIHFRAHADAIPALAFSPDGRTLASGSWDNTIKLWDAVLPHEIEIDGGSDGPRELRTLKGHEHWIKALAFSPDGSLLASASMDMTVRIWDARTGEEKGRLVGKEMALPRHADEWFLSVSFSPDGKLVAAGDKNGGIHVLDSRTAERVSIIRGATMYEAFDSRQLGSPHGSGVNAIDFSSDGSLLASGDGSGVIKVWHMPDATQVYALANRLSAADSVAFTREGSLLCHYYPPTEVVLWDLTTGRPIRSDFVPTDQGKWRVLATAGTKALVRRNKEPPQIWDPVTGHMSNPLSCPQTPGADFSISPDGMFFAQMTRPLSGRDGWRLSPDYIIKVWRVDSGDAVVDARISAAPGSLRPPLLTFSRHGRYVACAFLKSTVTLWDYGERREVVLDQTNDLEVSNFRNGDGWVPLTSMQSLEEDCLVRDGKHGDEYFAKRGTRIMVWDTQTGALVFRVNVLESTLGDLKFSGKGDLVMAGVHGTTVWSQAAWRETCHVPDAYAPVALSSNGMLLAGTWHLGPHMGIWDLKNGEILFKLRTEQTAQEPAAFSPNGKRLVTRGADRTLKVWDVESGTMLATFVREQGAGWITFLPKGYYQSSPEIPGNIAVVLDGLAAPVDQFDLVLNRPDLVMDKLGCKDQQLIRVAKVARQQRLRRMGLDEDQLGVGRSLPQINIDRLSVPYVTEEREITISGTAWGEDERIAGLLIWVNGVPSLFDSASLFPLDNEEDKPRAFRIPVSLCSGQNMIQICAVDRKGVQSPKSAIRVSCQRETEKPDLWLLTIAVSQYKARDYNLQFPMKDANDLVDVITNSPLRYDFSSRFAHIRTMKLLDEDVTRKGLNECRNFLERSRLDDTVIVFVAGHGFLTSDESYYFGTFDTDPADPAAHGLPFKALHSLLGDIPARRKLLLLDTCHAGEVEQLSRADLETSQLLAQSDRVGLPKESTVKVRTMSLARGVGGSRVNRREPKPQLDDFSLQYQPLFADLRRDTGASVLASCSGEEFSVEGPVWQNGVFTFAVIECLRTAFGDANRDGTVRISEMSDYVSRRVRQLTGGRQNPKGRRQNPLSDFPVMQLCPRVIELAPLDEPLVRTHSAALSPDGSTLLTGHTDGTAILWDSQKGRQRLKLQKGNGAVLAVRYSGDGARALTLTSMGVIGVWDIHSGQLLHAFESSDSPFRQARLSPDGSSLLTVQKTGAITRWEVASGKRLRSFPAVEPASLVSFSDEGERLLTTHGDEILVRNLPGGPTRRIAAAVPLGRRVAFAKGSDCIVFSDRDQGVLVILDAASGQQQVSLKSNSGRFMCWTVSADGRQIVTGQDHGTVDVWDLKDGHRLRTLTGHREMILYTAFLPDGNRCVSVSADNTARLWYVGRQ